MIDENTKQNCIMHKKNLTIESNDWDAYICSRMSADASAQLAHYETLETYKHTMNVGTLIDYNKLYYEREIAKHIIVCAQSQINNLVRSQDKKEE
jgi:hypothetical protein|tara:strand:- start:331 stop:615 length:285 start_codon:yes stop_codon:yes gene_type:complete